MPKGRPKERSDGLFRDRADHFVAGLPMDIVFTMIREGAELNRKGKIGPCVLRAQGLAFIKSTGNPGSHLVMVMLQIEQACHKRIAGLWLKDHPEWLSATADAPQC